MTETTDKFCTECRFHGWWEYIICRRPLTDRRDPVNGELADTLDVACSRERKPGKTFFKGRERCGPDGQFWEPLPPPPSVGPF